MSNIKLTRKIESQIRVLIRTWEGKFGWKEIIAAIKNDFDLTITKPSLISNPVIYPEYLAKKQRKSGITDDPILVDASKAKLIKTIKKLEKKVEKQKGSFRRGGLGWWRPRVALNPSLLSLAASHSGRGKRGLFLPPEMWRGGRDATQLCRSLFTDRDW